MNIKGGAQHKDHSGSASASKHENIVLVGRTGNGKSATANSLIGRKVFESKAHASGVTMQCQTHETVTKDGHNIRVIDTPGVLDLSVSAKFISKEIVNCLNLAEGGIHAVLLVLSARTPITDEEEETLSTLQALFGTQILGYVIVVFTGGDVLEDNDETLDDFIARDCPPFIKEVISMCGNRKVLMDNKARDEGKKAEQVHRLLSLVDDIRRSNRGGAYTDNMYHKIKKEKDRLHKEHEKHEELRAKNHPHELVSQMKQQLHESYQKNITQLSDSVEKRLNDALAAQEKTLTKLGKYVHVGDDNQQQPDSLISIPISIPLPFPTRGFCSIL